MNIITSNLVTLYSMNYHDSLSCNNENNNIIMAVIKTQWPRIGFIFYSSMNCFSIMIAIILAKCIYVIHLIPYTQKFSPILPMHFFDKNIFQ